MNEDTPYAQRRNSLSDELNSFVRGFQARLNAVEENTVYDKKDEPLYTVRETTLGPKPFTPVLEEAPPTIPSAQFCPGVSYLCDSTAYTGFKWGHFAFDGLGKRFLTLTYNSQFNAAETGPNGSDDDVKIHYVSHYTAPSTRTVDFTTSIGVAHATSGVTTTTFNLNVLADGHWTAPGGSAFGFGGGPSDVIPSPIAPFFNVNPYYIVGSGRLSYSTTGSLVNDPTTVDHWGYTQSASGSSGSNSYSETRVVTVDLTDEYTTATLKSDTLAALPAFPGTWDGSCFAQASLYVTESSYFIQKFRYKFTWTDESTTGFLNIYWIERFTPDGGGAVTDTPMEWHGDGTELESDIFIIDPPSSNGITTIESVTSDCDPYP